MIRSSIRHFNDSYLFCLISIAALNQHTTTRTTIDIIAILTPQHSRQVDYANLTGSFAARQRSSLRGIPPPQNNIPVSATIASPQVSALLPATRVEVCSCFFTPILLLLKCILSLPYVHKQQMCWLVGC